MLRFLTAVAVVLVAVGLMLMSYNAIFFGTGVAGARALLHHWRNTAVSLGATDTVQWMVIVLSALALGSLASRKEKQGRY